MPGKAEPAKRRDLRERIKALRARAKALRESTGGIDPAAANALRRDVLAIREEAKGRASSVETRRTAMAAVPPRVISTVRESVAVVDGVVPGDKAAAQARLNQFHQLAEAKGIDSDAVVRTVRRQLKPPSIASAQPAVQVREGIKLPTMYHGSPVQREALQPGSMLTTDSSWSAGYAMRINADGTEDFAGRVHQVEIVAGNPQFVTGTLHDAEGWVIREGERHLGRPPKALREAADAIHGATGIDAVVSRNRSDGEVNGALTLVAVKPQTTIDPVEVLSKSKTPIASNVERALQRHRRRKAG